MKKYRVLLILLVLLAVVMIAAAVDKTVGEQLHMWQPSPAYFEPNTPFHIMHGWVWAYINALNNFDYASYQAPGRGYITLELDGEMLKPDFFLRDQLVEYWPEYGDVRWYDNFWVYNFPDGLEGDHNFVLTYYFPCAAAEIEFGLSHGFVCEDKPNEVVPVVDYDLVVHFEPAP